MNTEHLDRFYREVQTIDLKFENVDSGTRMISLSHYNQHNTNYADEIAEHKESAVSVIMLLNLDQIQFQANRLQLISERFNLFWVWYSEQLKKFREGEFYTTEFIYYLETYLTITNSKQDKNQLWNYRSDDFLYDLGDAAMYKQGGVGYLLYYIKNIMGIVPKLTGNIEERAEEESRLINLTPSEFTLLCTLTEQQISTLFAYYSAGRYINSAVTLAEFSEMLLGSKPMAKPLQWLKSNRDLAYLLNTMYERKMINNRIWKSRVEKRGLFVNENNKPLTAQDLAQAITDYQTKGNPTEASKIDAILEVVKAQRD